MRARDIREGENKGDQRRSRGKGVRKKRDSDISIGKTFRHDPGTDYRSYQERRRREFRDGAP